MLIVLHIAAALAGQVTPEPATAPRVETEVRVVTLSGEGGPGRMDKDGDGFVSREEFMAPMAEGFARFDKDSDGRISTGEFTAGDAAGGHGDRVMIMRPGGRGMAGPGVHRFEMRRPDGREGQGGAPQIIILGGDHSEGDHRGRRERVEIRRVGPAGQHGPGDMDKDGDGKVSEDEFLAPLRDAFRRIDIDRSGALEAGEHSEGGGVHVIARPAEGRAD